MLATMVPLWLMTVIDAGTQILEACQYLHEDQSIAHRDLKLENIAISEDGSVRLIDFEYAAYTNRYGSPHVSPRYGPQRAFRGREDNSAILPNRRLVLIGAWPRLAFLVFPFFFPVCIPIRSHGSCLC
jgi:serine/threonine protein kinase